MLTANTAASNTASSAPAVSFREGDFYDLAAETDDVNFQKNGNFSDL